MFIYLFFSVLIWQEKLSRTPGGKHRELGIGLSHLHFNEIMSNWFIFTYILEILGYSLCPTLKILESSFWLWFQYIFCLGLDFFFSFCHLHCKMIHLLMTLNIQLCTCTFLFPPWNKATSCRWMKFPSTWGPQQGWVSRVFLTTAPLYATSPRWQGFPFVATSLLGENSWLQFFWRGLGCGSRSAWSLPCCRALLKHLCTHHLSWVTTSWASNEVCRAKLSLGVLWLNF